MYHTLANSKHSYIDSLKVA